jgi:ABC-2 type transport system permease protein
MGEFLRCTRAFFWRDAELALSYPLAFVMGIAGTVGQVLVLWLPAQLLGDSRIFSHYGGFLPFAVVGTAMMGFFMASYGSFASAIRAEQSMGTLEAVLMTPTSVSALIVGSCTFGMLRALLDSGLVLVGANLFYGLTFRGSVPAILLLIVLNNLVFVAAGILSATFAMVFKRGDPFRVLVGGASFLLGGVLYPSEVLPGWLHSVSEMLPITHGARALRGVALLGKPLGEFALELTVVGAFALVGLAASVTAFQWAVRRAKQEGTLLQY